MSSPGVLKCRILLKSLKAYLRNTINFFVPKYRNCNCNRFLTTMWTTARLVLANLPLRGLDMSPVDMHLEAVSEDAAGLDCQTIRCGSGQPTWPRWNNGHVYSSRIRFSTLGDPELPSKFSRLFAHVFSNWYEQMNAGQWTGHRAAAGGLYRVAQAG